MLVAARQAAPPFGHRNMLAEAWVALGSAVPHVGSFRPLVVVLLRGRCTVLLGLGGLFLLRLGLGFRSGCRVGAFLERRNWSRDALGRRLRHGSLKTPMR